MDMKFTDQRELGQGDYNAAIDKGKLILPAMLQPFVASFHAKNVEAFFSACVTFPSELMGHCGWTQEQVSTAMEKLKGQLRGFVLDGLLDADSSQQPALPLGGARRPDGWKPQ